MDRHDVKSLQVSVGPAVQRERDGDVKLAEERRQEGLRDTKQLSDAPQDGAGRRRLLPVRQRHYQLLEALAASRTQGDAAANHVFNDGDLELALGAVREHDITQRRLHEDGALPGRRRAAAADTMFAPQMGLPARCICLARVPDPAQGALALAALVGVVTLRPLRRELPWMVVLGPFALETADSAAAPTRRRRLNVVLGLRHGRMIRQLRLHNRRQTTC
jgi:hypothetical protein